MTEEERAVIDAAEKWAAAVPLSWEQDDAEESLFVAAQELRAARERAERDDQRDARRMPL